MKMLRDVNDERQKKNAQRRVMFTIHNEEKSANLKDLNKSGDLHNNYQTSTERPR